MELTRRQFLLGAAGGTAGLTLLPPLLGRVGPAFGQTAPDPATAGRNRLVVVFLGGGNDGLNTVIPRADVPGAARYSVYRKVRPTVAYKPDDSLPLDRLNDIDHALGLNAKLATLHRFYRDGRLAVVQGVDYPKHNYSHFASTDIWHSGEPERSPSSGWIGRHLDRAGIGEGELRAVGVGYGTPLMLQGRGRAGASLVSIAATKFLDDGAAAAPTRHNALKSFGAARPNDPLRYAVGRLSAQTVGVVEDLAKVPAPPEAGSTVGDALLTARTLLEHNLGVECVFVQQPGYDTHTTQVGTHENLLSQLDTALETFYLGTAKGAALGNLGPLAPAVADRTLVLIVSEFGRRIGEAGGAGVAGTDHGAAAPVLLIGPPAGRAPGVTLVAGLHGDHPKMGTTAVPADNLEMTADLRTVYQAVLQSWLADPDPYYETKQAFPGLFSDAPAKVKAATSSSHTAATSGAATSNATAADAGRGAADLVHRGSRSALGQRRSASGHSGVHPVTLGAALLFDAIVAALLIRTGQVRKLWTASRTLEAVDVDAPG